MLARLPAAWSGRAARPRKITPETRFRAGDRLWQPSLGEGMVVSSAARDDDEEVTVAFPDNGVTTLMASFAETRPRLVIGILELATGAHSSRARVRRS